MAYSMEEMFDTEIEQALAALMQGEDVDLSSMQQQLDDLLSTPGALERIAAKLLEEGIEISAKLNINGTTRELDIDKIHTALGYGKDSYAHVIISDDGKISLNTQDPVNGNNRPSPDDYVARKPDMPDADYPDSVLSHPDFPLVQGALDQMLGTIDNKWALDELNDALADDSLSDQERYEAIKSFYNEMMASASASMPDDVDVRNSNISVSQLVDMYLQTVGSEHTMSSLSQQMQGLRQGMTNESAMLDSDLDGDLIAQISEGISNNSWELVSSSPESTNNGNERLLSLDGVSQSNPTMKV